MAYWLEPGLNLKPWFFSKSCCSTVGPCSKVLISITPDCFINLTINSSAEKLHFSIWPVSSSVESSVLNASVLQIKVGHYICLT